MNKSKVIVVKFGGKSLATPDRVRVAASKVAEAVKRGYKVAVVVSAIGDTTDRLLNIVESACRGKAEPKLVDEILSIGERLSCRIFAATLRSLGLEARFFDPKDEDWPILTDENFNNASPLEESIARVEAYVKPLMNKGVVPIIPGFVGRSKTGQVTTLGRGGSDTTAFIVSRGVSADQVILVTDVEGIMTGDPKLIPDPRRIDVISVEELAALADVGVKFIHRKALAYKDPSIDAKVVSFKSESLDSEGTLVKGGLKKGIDVFQAYDKPVGYITLVGRGLADHPEIISEVVSSVTSVGSILGLSSNSQSLLVYTPESICVEAAAKIHRLIEKYRGRALAVAVRKGLSLIAIRGFGLEESPGVIARISQPVSREGINIHGIYTVSSTVFLLVDWNLKDRVLEILKKSFSEVEGNHV